MVKKKKKIKKIKEKKPSKSKKVAFSKSKSNEIKIPETNIKIVGIGGGGNSIVSEIASRASSSSERDKVLKKIDFICLNTDIQSLKKTSKNCKKINFGEELTQGLGCGMDPEVGREAANRGKEKIEKALEGGDFYIFISCFGGGTGSGATPFVAEICKKFKKTTLGIFTLPFGFEGKKKQQIAKDTLKDVTSSLNSIVIIPNDKIFDLVDENTPLKKALSAINQKLCFDLEGMIEMIQEAGLINIDWADFKSILGSGYSASEKGKLCYLNRVVSKGEERSSVAVKEVVKNILNDYDLKGADRILFNIEGEKDLKMSEVSHISKTISEFNRKAKIIFGISSLSERLFYQKPSSNKGNELGITLLATGMEKRFKKEEKKSVKTEHPIKKKAVEKKVSKKKVAKKKAVKKKVSKKKPTKKKTPKKKVVKKKTPKKKIEYDLNRKTVRKNALAVKKDVEKAEREILKEEEKWSLPAFLRRK
jgi:cell division protein FtsZ